MSNDDDVDIDAMLSETTALKAELTNNKLRLKESRASCFRNHHMAYMDVKKASIDKRMASGVLVTLTGIGGAEIISVLIQDGLSNETIECIRKDIKRSQEIQSSFAITDKTK